MSLTRKQFNWLGVMLFILIVACDRSYRHMVHANIDQTGSFNPVLVSAMRGSYILMMISICAYLCWGYYLRKKHHASPKTIFGDRSYHQSSR